MKALRISILAILLAACQALEEPAVTSPQDEQRPEWLPSGGFEWTKAEDVETRNMFLRNFGVGYSYNAVRGSFCDWKDIRCQIVNRRAIQDYQTVTGQIFYGYSTAQSVSRHSQFNYSKRDYIAAVAIDGKVKIDLGLYNGEKRKRQFFIEDGVQETFYYSLDEEIVMAEMSISPANVIFHYNYFEECDNFLTLSFINAVQHVAESDPSDIAVVDSLINIYGTHVITQAWLGGKIRVDLSNYMWRYKDEGIEEEEWNASGFLGAVKQANVSHTGSDDYRWLEEARLNITAYGGDQSSLTGLLGEHDPDGSRTFSTEGIETWRLSLSYDPENELASNVELVDMRLTPIWEFAEAVDPDAAARIKAAIHQDVALQEALLGENNFFDTSFPIRYPKAHASYRRLYWENITVTDEPDDPIVVNIVSGGRFVACVCHEKVGKKDLWVCYPIYEGKIKMACGKGVDEQGRVYSVQWINGNVTSMPIESSRAGNTFYITGGEIGVTPQEGVRYAPSKYMPYIELAGGVLTSGAYFGIPYRVVRDGEDFVLRLEKDEKVPANMVGWDEDGRRLPDYTYIYNPNELKPYGN